MLHTKSQSQWPFGSREEKIQRLFTIYGHGGHVSHVTITICIMFWLTNDKELPYERTCNGFVLQMAHFYRKKSIVKKSLQSITKWYLGVSSLMSTIYFLH